MYWFFLLTGLSSLAEITSLGAVLAFIGLLIDPDWVLSSPTMSEVVNSLGIISGSELVLPLTIAFAVIPMLAGALRLDLF